MIYFTSDLHLGHDRDWLWGKRGFSNGVVEMGNTIIENINKTVRPDDELYILGDLMLIDDSWINEIRSLQCRNIHIILGNHDTANRINLYRACWNVVEITYATILKYGKYKFYLSHYPTLTGNTDDKGPRNALINLHGHTHQTTNFIDGKWNMYHVGVDSHDMKPVSIETILEDIRAEYFRHLEE